MTHSCDKPLSETMVLSLLTHICVIRPQWVKILLCPCDDKQHWVNLYMYVIRLFRVMTFGTRIRKNRFPKKFQIYFEISQIDLKISIVSRGGLVGWQDNINTYTHALHTNHTHTHPLYCRNCFIMQFSSRKPYAISRLICVRKNWCHT